LLEDSPGYAQRVFTKLSTEIRKELDALTHNAQVYALAEERPALISQYVFLNRALKSSATVTIYRLTLEQPNRYSTSTRKKDQP
jgi:hypothetical protein